MIYSELFHLYFFYNSCKCQCPRRNKIYLFINSLKLLIGMNHTRGGTLDLLMTDVPDLVMEAVVALVGSSDHSSLSTAILMSMAVPNFCVRRRCFRNSELIGLQSVMQYVSYLGESTLMDCQHGVLTVQLRDEGAFISASLIFCSD